MKSKIQESIVVITFLLCSATLASTASAQTVSYSYDAAGKLTYVSYSTGASIQYEYDAAGNITKATYSLAGPPPKATLLSPAGTIKTKKPTYKWSFVASATYYQLYVSDSSAAGKIKAWYSAADAGCSAAAGSCSVTPSTTLASGDGQWWIQTWNENGYGPWSDGMSFTVASGPPGKATLISPSGNITTTTPAYTWNAVAAATSYYLWVNDSSTGSGKVQTWYSAEQAGCTSGTGNCSTTPSTALASGAAQWWIQTWNENGYGPWSDGMTFTVGGAGPPGKATLISPSGTITTAKPAYSWNAVTGATWYLLWVQDSANSVKIQSWFTSAQAGCTSGIGACSVVPSTVLPSDTYQWWVQTWNDSGYGPWSAALGFTVSK